MSNTTPEHKIVSLTNDICDTFRWAGKQIRKNADACPAAGKVIAAIDEIRDEVRVVRERDPAATSDLEVLLLYSGLHAVLAHKVSHRLYKKGHFFTARAVSQAARAITGIEIHPGATIGKGFFIDHGAGVVIGETAEIGDNCTLYQGVTLGGTGKESGKRHPTLGDNVMVGAGAKCLGNFTIGSNSKIASGAVVLGDVPENSTAVGIPAHIVKKDGERVAKNEADLDQIHIPDPIETEIEALCARIHALEEAVCMLPMGDDNDTDGAEVVE